MLDVRGLRAGGDGPGSLHGIDLHVAAGEIVAVVGPPGAGKTMLARALSGLISTEGGVVRFQDRVLGRATPGERLAAGLVHVPQGGHAFPNLSLRDNLLLGATRRARGQRTHTLGAVLQAFPRLVPCLECRAGARPIEEQRMLAIGRGLMARPRLLVLDEPGQGLHPAAVVELFRAIAALPGQGLSILLTGTMPLPCLSIAGRIYLLERGRVIRDDLTAPS